MLKSNHRLTASAKALSDERIFLTASMIFIAINLRDT